MVTKYGKPYFKLYADEVDKLYQWVCDKREVGLNLDNKVDSIFTGKYIQLIV